jgi:hypothetical protein
MAVPPFSHALRLGLGEPGAAPVFGNVCFEFIHTA